ncbi:hypothetical protein [Pseudomonas sp. Marseille-QA0892]
MWIERKGWGLGVCALLSLAGCQTELTQTRYSADYQANLPAHGTPFPDACVALAGEGSTRQLPPGCANALNLMRMVERPAELRKGSDGGSALAAPVGRAVQRYLLPDEAARQQRQADMTAEAETATGGVR